MPLNDCIPWYEDADRLPAEAFTAVTGKRFVIPAAARLSGPMIPATAQVGTSDPTDGGNIRVAHAVAGAIALGVSSWDAAVGEKLTILTDGVVPVLAGAAITAGNQIQVGANGTAIPWDGTLASRVVGIAVDDTANGADAQIKLIH